MYEYSVNEPEDLVSVGFGPCIGVAFISTAGGAVMHSNDPRITTGDEFLTEIESSITDVERAQITPVVFGGALDEDPMVSEETKAARTWICGKLTELGFNTPVTHWCKTPHESHDVKISSKDRSVTIVSRVPGRAPMLPTVFIF